MAGDWIPMRLDLHEDPAVMQMADQLDCREEVIVGYLHRIWSYASRQSKDGIVNGISMASLGRVVGLPGFPEEMEKVGWLESHDGYLIFPSFETWLGQSAKKRLDATKRKAASRSQQVVTNVTKESQTSVTKSYIPRDLKRTIRSRDGDTCQYCGWTEKVNAPFGVYIGATMVIDHVFPESRGGDTCEANLVCACSVCNSLKGAKTPEEAGMKLSESVPDSVVEYLRLMSQVSQQVVTNVTKTGDKSATTEEKRREEKRISALSPQNEQFRQLVEFINASECEIELKTKLLRWADMLQLAGCDHRGKPFLNSIANTEAIGNLLRNGWSTGKTIDSVVNSIAGQKPNFYDPDEHRGRKPQKARAEKL